MALIPDSLEDIDFAREVFKVYSSSKQEITLETYFNVASRFEFFQITKPITMPVARKYLNFYRKDNLYFQEIYEAWWTYRKGESFVQPKLSDFVRSEA